MYTQVPRAVMWLIRGEQTELGPIGETVMAEVGSFYISRGCITNAHFEAHRPDFQRQTDGDDDPVVGVSFREAVAYAEWYAALSKKPFRLPTELEWELAARAMGRVRYPWGDTADQSASYAWTAENSEARTHPVDQLRPSKSGIYGMIGNVWEWTSALDRPFAQALQAGHDDLSLTGARIARGGGFLDPVATLGCARREGLAEQTSRPDLGFRIVRSL